MAIADYKIRLNKFQKEVKKSLDAFIDDVDFDSVPNNIEIKIVNNQVIITTEFITIV